MKPGILTRIRLIVRVLVKLNLFKTLYFNFKVLPFHQALKLPFHFYGRVDFAKLTGTFSIGTEVQFGMIIFGGKHEVVINPQNPTRIHNSGHIHFDGRAVFAKGVNIMVWENGRLTFGNNLLMGSLNRIIVFREMRFGHDVLISWECQFFDTDFHFFENEFHEIKDNCSPVSIADKVWIGARSTILKGTSIGENSIVAANSLCSGNYKEKFGDGVVLGGSPVQCLKKGVKYVVNKRHERELFRYFMQNPNTVRNWNP